MFLVGPCRRRPLESSLRGLLESLRKPAGGTFSLGHYQLDKVVWRDQGSCERLTSVHTWSCMRVAGCSWCLCISMLCSQLIIMHAWSCDYAPLCCADSLWLCMHVRLIRHIYAMQSACNQVCMCIWLCTFKLCSQHMTMHACVWDHAHLRYAVNL